MLDYLFIHVRRTLPAHATTSAVKAYRRHGLCTRAAITASRRGCCGRRNKRQRHWPPHVSYARRLRHLRSDHAATAVEAYRRHLQQTRAAIIGCLTPPAHDAATAMPPTPTPSSRHTVAAVQVRAPPSPQAAETAAPRRSNRQSIVNTPFMPSTGQSINQLPCSSFPRHNSQRAHSTPEGGRRGIRTNLGQAFTRHPRAPPQGPHAHPPTIWLRQSP